MRRSRLTEWNFEADEHGAVCVVCLAEYYGYERIGAEEVLRKPLG